MARHSARNSNQPTETDTAVIVLSRFRTENRASVKKGSVTTYPAPRRAIAGKSSISVRIHRGGQYAMWGTSERTVPATQPAATHTPIRVRRLTRRRPNVRVERLLPTKRLGPSGANHQAAPGRAQPRRRWRSARAKGSASPRRKCKVVMESA